MYCKFYGLKERPFNVTSDPAFFFFSKKHKEALSHLDYGITQRKGIVVITGEIGTGKTTLCRFYLNGLRSSIKTAFILNPLFSDSQLLQAILNDFGINSKRKTRFACVNELNSFLISESENGNNVVLFIDEAQNMKPRTLEQIRLLSNLETEKDKLLQIVLVGQPELNRRLDLYELRQLRQRIIVKYHILPLEKQEIKDYINHRLRIAGAEDELHFTDDAIDKICKFSNGTPRLINIICDRSLLAGFVAETNSITADIVHSCSDELLADLADVKT
ncbi:ExeA family protein [Candidatus Omnitrophota bacterium]